MTILPPYVVIEIYFIKFWLNYPWRETWFFANFHQVGMKQHCTTWELLHIIIVLLLQFVTEKRSRYNFLVPPNIFRKRDF